MCWTMLDRSKRGRKWMRAIRAGASMKRRPQRSSTRSSRLSMCECGDQGGLCPVVKAGAYATVQVAQGYAWEFERCRQTWMAGFFCGSIFQWTKIICKIPHGLWPALMRRS